MSIQYVYIQSEPGLWTVGFYSPNKEWISESDYNDKEEAAKRVISLNGGSPIISEVKFTSLAPTKRLLIASIIMNGLIGKYALRESKDQITLRQVSYELADELIEYEFDKVK
jgi:hypothetical protein